MTLRDQYVALQPRDRALLQALREDHAECGQGLTHVDMQRIATTRWPWRAIRRLREAGHQIGSLGSGEDERWQLLDPEVDVERAVEGGPCSARKDDQASAPRPVDSSLSAHPDGAQGAPDDGRSATPGGQSSGALQLFELPSVRHFEREAA